MDNDVPAFRPIGIGSDIDEDLFGGDVDSDFLFRRAAMSFQCFVDKSLRLKQILFFSCNRKLFV